MKSRLTTLRFAMSTYCRATATKKRGGLSAATSAPQISVGHTIDCLSYAVPVFLSLLLYLLQYVRILDLFILRKE